jgi:predicted DCC family thiol-disulfide oxidoreductase YuxK
MITTATHPPRDTVLFDGRCRFCIGQIAMLRRLDVSGRLQFTSLHERAVAADFPELSSEALQAEMFVVDRQGNARGGALGWRYLTRRLPLLWPLAVLLHVPGSMPLWNWIYRLIARNRHRLAGTCADGTCRIH